MNSRVLKNDFSDIRARHRDPAGVVIGKLAMIFVMFCVLATLVMVIGK